jgi:hypothetical protein
LEYPEHDKRIQMLKVLYREAQDAQSRGEEKLWLDFVHGRDKPQLTISGTEADLAQEVGLEGAEAIRLLEELGENEYISLDLDRYGFSADVGLVGVAFLDKGITAISELPDPKEELLSSLDVIGAAIEGLQDVPPDKKNLGRKAVGELKTFAHAISPAAAREVTKAIAAAVDKGV